MAILGVDIGGTNIRTAIFLAPDQILRRQQIRGSDLGTPVPIPAFVELLGDCIHQSPKPIEAIGVSVAAVVDPQRGYIKVSENVGWKDVPLKEILETKFRIPVVVDADAFCGAEAEARIGSGTDQENLQYVAIGTGIGHALVLNKKVWHGQHGAANVFGHLKVEKNGAECYCGEKGCVCQFSAGKGIARLGQLALGKTHPPLRGEDVVKACKAGEAWAINAIEEAHAELALAISAAYNLLDIECTILGGGVISDIYPNIERLHELLEEFVYPEIRPIILRRGSLGADAILTGAALMAFDKIERKG